MLPLGFAQKLGFERVIKACLMRITSSFGELELILLLEVLYFGSLIYSPIIANNRVILITDARLLDPMHKIMQ
jgi:hypothetical protein